jgi:prepilin-type N-terminal cleavage/methylation domain-containing protein
MKKKGFTLIELIVSTTIIGLVTGLFLANYSSANRRTDLVMTAQKVVADIHLAQNYALGLARYGTSTATYVPTGGWGVRFDLGNLGNNQYVIFADKDGNKKYDSGEAVEGFGAQANYLPDNIKIQSLSVSPANITFLPPDPITTISNGISASSTSVDIVLNDIKTNATKTIRVNFLGLVEVID